MDGSEHLNNMCTDFEKSQDKSSILDAVIPNSLESYYKTVLVSVEYILPVMEVIYFYSCY